MSDNLAPWPPAAPFPESLRQSSPSGPDFPASAGDREHGKFRPGSTPRLTKIAVSNDDGSAIGSSLAEGNEEILFLLRAMVTGLSILTGEDLFEAV